MGSQVNNNNINNFEPPNPANQNLKSFEDYQAIANGGLGISAQQERFRQSNTQRILEPEERQWIDHCGAAQWLGFEDSPDGTMVESQYAPLVRFLADDLRAPVIVGAGGRNGVPTASPQQSLLNAPKLDVPSPLVMTFEPPQRAVRLTLGQAGFTNAPRERVRAVLRAFDQNEVPMGMIVRDLPAPNIGVTELVDAVAIFPDQLIRRAELSYETGPATGGISASVPIAEPVLIDDLVLCGQLDETGLQPLYPPQPQFGDLPVHLRIMSEIVDEAPGAGPNDPPKIIRTAFTGLPFRVDSNPYATDLALTRPEGTTLSIEALPTFGSRRFLYWRHDSGVSFGNGLTTVPLTLLRDGTLTAVYEGRRLEQPPREPIEDRLEGIGRCVEQCFRPGLPRVK